MQNNAIFCEKVLRNVAKCFVLFRSHLCTPLRAIALRRLLIPLAGQERTSRQDLRRAARDGMDFMRVEHPQGNFGIERRASHRQVDGSYRNELSDLIAW